MENKKKLGTGAIIGIVVLAVLSLLGLFAELFETITYSPQPSYIIIELIPAVIIYIAAAYYAVCGYKKPHGDLLRYIFLLFALRCAASVVATLIGDISVVTIDVGTTLIIGLRVLCIILVSYMSGRLDKIKKNVPLLIVSTVLLLAVSIVFLVHYLIEDYSGWICVVWDFSTLILWLDLMFAYILRYKEHKEAGLTDK